MIVENMDQRGENAMEDIELLPHDPHWTSMFSEERDRLLSALGEMVRGIDHVGSTAVSGLVAKPIIDIMVSVEILHLGTVKEILEDVGYLHVPIDERGRLFFRKGMPRTHHLHVVRRGSWEYWKHIFFRDRLVDNRDETREYAALKMGLAERFHHDREAYTKGKEDFIEGLLAKAVLERLVRIDRSLWD
ncbi:MAG TPA: GrpB family protein [Methanomassiliicoccales archaeon]|nr:GrpB family protein [Methanomassiliicoccales archaeon]